MKIYISGPMADKPNFNFPAFDAAAAKLRALGHEVFNPADKDRERHGNDFAEKFSSGDLKEATAQGFNLGDALAEDCRWICKEAEAIYMLNGWEGSSGAKMEHLLARCMRLKFFYEDTL